MSMKTFFNKLSTNMALFANGDPQAAADYDKFDRFFVELDAIGKAYKKNPEPYYRERTQKCRERLIEFASKPEFQKKKYSISDFLLIVNDEINNADNVIAASKNACKEGDTWWMLDRFMLMQDFSWNAIRNGIEKLK